MRRGAGFHGRTNINKLDRRRDFHAFGHVNKRAVEKKHLNRLRRFLLGDPSENLFFYAYRFDIIPIELISSIYEKFYSTKPDQQRDEGGYYTPAALVDFVLSQTLDEKILAKLQENRTKPKTKTKWQERLEQMQEAQKEDRHHRQNRDLVRPGVQRRQVVERADHRQRDGEQVGADHQRARRRRRRAPLQCAGRGRPGADAACGNLLRVALRHGRRQVRRRLDDPGRKEISAANRRDR